MANFSEGRDAAGNGGGSSPGLLDEFRQAWEQALDCFTPPNVDWFLQRAGEESGPIAERLYAVDSEYRNRIGTEIRSAEHSPAQNPTVIARNEDSEADPEPAAFAGTIDFEPSEADEDGSHKAFAATMIGDTANADKDQTDPASGRKDSSTAERRVAGYEIEGTLGRGGMGVVYRARQTGLNRLVALKMILGGSHAAPEYLARFQSEAEAVAQLQHPNIVQIYDIGQHEGLPFFSLELIDGQSLEAERANRPMEPLRSAEITETLARAMGYAHNRGIVHRDLKPANVLLTAAGVPKVTDFGLVKRLEEDSGQTATGTVMGTPSYMAPEQAWGSKDVGPLADVYSLGAMLYALITGRPPFLGTNAAETVMQLRQQEPVPPSRLQPSLPRDLETICLKCLQKDPGKRYADAGELAEDLRRFQANEPILARPVSRAERAWRWCRRNPSLATSGGIAIVLAVCLMIGGPLAALLINQERDTAIKAQGLAETNEQKATKNAGLARQQRDYAVLAFNTLVERVPTDLKNVPGTNRIKQNLILTAMDGLTKVETVGGEESKDLVMARRIPRWANRCWKWDFPTTPTRNSSRCHDILLRLRQNGHRDARVVRASCIWGVPSATWARRPSGSRGPRRPTSFTRNRSKPAKPRSRPRRIPYSSNRNSRTVTDTWPAAALDLGRPQEALDDGNKSIVYLQECLVPKPHDADLLRGNCRSEILAGACPHQSGEPCKSGRVFSRGSPRVERTGRKGQGRHHRPNQPGPVLQRSGHGSVAFRECGRRRGTTVKKRSRCWKTCSARTAAVPMLSCSANWRKLIIAWGRPARNCTIPKPPNTWNAARRPGGFSWKNLPKTAAPGRIICSRWPDTDKSRKLSRMPMTSPRSLPKMPMPSICWPAHTPFPQRPGNGPIKRQTATSLPSAEELRKKASPLLGRL